MPNKKTKLKPKEEIEKELNIPASDLPLAKEPEDFRSSFHWRVFRVMSELVDGWQFLADFRRTVTRRLSIYVTKVLLYTPITANQVSFLMILFSFAAGILFTFNNYWYSLIVILLMQWALNFDANDGEIARYRKTGSLNGQFVDIVAHSIAMPTAIIGITIANANNLNYVILGLLATTFVILSSTVSIFKHEIIFDMLTRYARKEKSPKPSPELKNEAPIKQSKIKFFLKKIFLLFKYPYISYVMGILAVFNRLEWTLIILGVASPILWTIYAWKEFKIGTQPHEYLFEPYKS